MLSEGLGLLAEPITQLATAIDDFMSGIGEFFTNLVNGIVDGFNSLITWFEDFALATWQEIVDLLTIINDDLVYPVMNFFAHTINPFDENFFLNPFKWWIQDNIAEPIGIFFSTTMNPFSDDFFLKKAFVPSAEFWTMNEERFENIWTGKFAFVDKIKGFVDSFKDALVNDSNAPSFNMTLPSKWGGSTVSIINFGAFDSIRLLVKNIVRIFIWLFFIFKMYKKVPDMIY